MMINPRLNATMSYPRFPRNSHQLDFFYLLVGYPDKPNSGSKNTIQKSSFHFFAQKLDSKALWSLNPSTFQSPKFRTVPTGLWLQFTSTRDPLRKRAMGGEDQSIECQVKPANNSLTCCYAISKERCEETLKPFLSFCDDLTWVPFLK